MWRALKPRSVSRRIRPGAPDQRRNTGEIKIVRREALTTSTSISAAPTTRHCSDVRRLSSSTVASVFCKRHLGMFIDAWSASWRKLRPIASCRDHCRARSVDKPAALLGVWISMNQLTVFLAEPATNTLRVVSHRGTNCGRLHRRLRSALRVVSATFVALYCRTPRQRLLHPAPADLDKISSMTRQPQRNGRVDGQRQR